MSKFIILALFLIEVSPAFGQTYTQYKLGPGIYRTYSSDGRSWITRREDSMTFTTESPFDHRFETSCQWMHNCRSRYQR